MFTVITEIPKTVKGSIEGGNLVPFIGPLYKPQRKADGSQDFESPYLEDKDLNMQLMMSGYSIQVFRLGEILLLDSNGREYSSPGRKPSYWFVETEEFDTLKEAVARANEVRR